MKKTKTSEKHLRARRADSRDEEVGRRVRSRRLESRLSQTELADKIGVTFQQIQKYEKGANRVGASRLTQIADVLTVPIPTLFSKCSPTLSRTQSATAHRAGKSGSALTTLVTASNSTCRILGQVSHPIIYPDSSSASIAWTRVALVSRAAPDSGIRGCLRRPSLSPAPPDAAFCTARPY